MTAKRNAFVKSEHKGIYLDVDIWIKQGPGDYFEGIIFGYFSPQFGSVPANRVFEVGLFDISEEKVHAKCIEQIQNITTLDIEYLNILIC